MSTMANDPRLIAERPGLAGTVAQYRRRIAQGDIAQLPVIIGVVLIWTIFQITTNGVFLGSFNLTNLALQMSPTGTIAIGVVFILLLGEIDLTVGVVSGFCAAIVAVLNVKSGVPAPIAVLAGIGAGTLIGLLQGFWITRFRIPAFVVTLAGLIAWQGGLLWVLGDTGAINLSNPFITGLSGTFLPPILAWPIGALFVLYFAGTWFLSMRGRRAAGLTAESVTVLGVRVLILAVLVAIPLVVFGQDRGLPLSLVLFVGLVAILDYAVRRTRVGRMVYAIGGNPEAARRAGIPVERVRIAVFMLASSCAAWGGILAASRLLAVNQGSGTGSELLNAIAAAVIGGTSLFGGRGTVWAALLGMLVIASISNGMDILSLSSPVKFVITGIVLLAAVTIDALARRGREASGRA